MSETQLHKLAHTIATNDYHHVVPTDDAQRLATDLSRKFSAWGWTEILYDAAIYSVTIVFKSPCPALTGRPRIVTLFSTPPMTTDNPIWKAFNHDPSRN